MGFGVLKGVLDFFDVSRRRKTSKWKSLIKKIRHCLMVHKRRRDAIVRQSRIDIAHLFHYGWQEMAMSRVDQLHKDQCRLAAYEQLEQFCDCIDANIQAISKCRKLPNDVNEALSRLIYAASRCGELRELQSIRGLCKQQFGQNFERVNVELLPGNNVDAQLKYNLSTNSVSDDKKLQLICEILRDQDSNLRRDKVVSENTTNTPPPHAYSRISRISTESSPIEEDGSWVGTLSSESTYIKKKNVCERRAALIVKEIGRAERDGLLCKESESYCKEQNRDRMAQPCHGELEENCSGHVHPKLPDYDDLVAMFTDMKKDYMKKTSKNVAPEKWMRQ